MKFSVGITLYNPKSEYIDRINDISNEFDSVYVYDNSSIKKEEIKKILENPKITYIFNGENNGLAEAFNFFIEKTNGIYDYLCILDQDSHFTIENIKRMKDFLRKNKNPNLAIAAPSYSNLSLNNKSKNKKNVKVDWVINSGSFLNLQTIKKYDLKYDSNYFLDRIDSDFCKMINLKKLDIIVHRPSILEQELGYIYKKRNAHHPVRHYYIFRDRMYYNQKFYNKFSFITLSILQSIRHITNIVLFEDNKKKKLKSCIYGYKDYKNRKFGKSLIDFE